MNMEHEREVKVRATIDGLFSFASYSGFIRIRSSKLYWHVHYVDKLRELYFHTS